MNFYQERYSDPRVNAQDNLSGRTHYADDATLRYHKARILEAFVSHSGLAFALIETVALDPDNRSRGYRPVVFDVFGTVVNDRAKFEDCHKGKPAAVKDLCEFLAGFDAKAHTLAAIDREEKQHIRECADMRVKVGALGMKVAA